MATIMERGEHQSMAMADDERGRKLEHVGGLVLRYGLVVALLWVGALKFTSYEAESVHGLASHSPLLAWLTKMMSVQDFSMLLGVVEISLALLIATRPIWPKASAMGSMGSIIMFLITLSFLFTTPGVVQDGHTFPALSGMPGQFLLKDVLLLGAAIWTAGEALRAAGREGA